MLEPMPLAKKHLKALVDILDGSLLRSVNLASAFPVRVHFPTPLTGPGAS